jgi:hypothetical protein
MRKTLSSPICWLRCCAVVLLALLHQSLCADTTVFYPRHESGTTLHSDFYFEVLREALERTRAEFGPYRLQYTAQGMNPTRAAAELAAASGVVHVDVRSWNEERGKSLHQVPFPVDRGLIGYRLLLIREQDQARFDAVRTLDDLKQFSFGLLASWGDVRILEHNGLKVVRGSSYDGLFRMLSAGRFDAFSRDIDEIQLELERKGIELPDLAIERTLLLRYPSARYFFVSRTMEGLRLGARIEIGLNQMREDGSFDVMFRKHKREQLQRLNIQPRRVILLTNPQPAPPTPENLRESLASILEDRRKQ